MPNQSASNSASKYMSKSTQWSVFKIRLVPRHPKSHPQTRYADFSLKRHTQVSFTLPLSSSWLHAQLLPDSWHVIGASSSLQIIFWNMLEWDQTLQWWLVLKTALASARVYPVSAMCSTFAQTCCPGKASDDLCLFLCDHSVCKLWWLFLGLLQVWVGRARPGSKLLLWGVVNVFEIRHSNIFWQESSDS